MDRREFLAVTATALGTGSLAGCTGGQRSSAGDGTPTRSTPDTTPTRTPTQSPSTPDVTPTRTPSHSPSASGSDDGASTPTPVPFPDSCQSLPDIDGLPAPPSELTRESVQSYVTEFERVYAVATNPRYGGIASLRVTHVETVGDRYRVQLEVEAERETPTPRPDGSTPTPIPVDAYAHRTLYRVKTDRMVRELRGHAGGRRLSSDCWILPGPEP